MQTFYVATTVFKSNFGKVGQIARHLRVNIRLRNEIRSLSYALQKTIIEFLNFNTFLRLKRMTTYNFDNRIIQWYKLGDIEHVVCSILDIDHENNIVDIILKFEPHKQIILHRHMVLNKSLVIQGEHRLYEPNGEIKEVRAVGSYTSSPASNEPHRECGGDEGAIVFFSIRGNAEVLYEVLDDKQNLIGTLGLQDFIELFEANQEHL